MIYILWNENHFALGTTGLGTKENFYISVFRPLRLIGDMDISNGKGLRLHKLEWDLRNAFHLYKWIMPLPSEESSGIGLSEKAMRQWWEKFDGENFVFETNDNDCLMVVKKALCEGVNQSTSLSQTAKENLKLFMNLKVGMEHSLIEKRLETAVKIIQNEIPLNDNSYQTMFNLLASIEDCFQLIFDEKRLFPYLGFILAKSEQIEQIAIHLKNRDAEDCANTVTNIVCNMLHSFLALYLKNHTEQNITLQKNMSCGSLLTVLRSVPTKDTDEMAFLSKANKKDIQQIKGALSARYLFWSDKTHECIADEKLLQRIDQEIKSENNPQKEFFRSRTMQATFVK